MPRTVINYIPRADGAFDSFVVNFNEAITNWFTEQGIEKDMLDAFYAAAEVWAERYPAHTAAQAAADGAKQAKDSARAALEEQIRPLARYVQAFPTTTNADRARMGITVRDTGGSTSPAPAPTTRPLALIESGQRLTHQLRLVDESTPTRRARPRGVQRAEVFVALTAPGHPAPPIGAGGEPGAYRYVGSVTRGETTLSFESDKGGMQAHYVSRWVSTSGATGPWSDTASATVAA